MDKRSQNEIKTKLILNPLSLCFTKSKYPRCVSSLHIYKWNPARPQSNWLYLPTPEITPVQRTLEKLSRDDILPVELLHCHSMNCEICDNAGVRGMDVNTWMLCCETGSSCGLGGINNKYVGVLWRLETRPDCLKGVICDYSIKVEKSLCWGKQVERWFHRNHRPVQPASHRVNHCGDTSVVPGWFHNDHV